MHKSTKISNTPTPPIHIVMQIIPDIYLTDAQSHKQLISSMLPSLHFVPIKNMRPLESVPTRKQEQFTQECYIKIGPETSLDQLINPEDLHQKYKDNQATIKILLVNIITPQSRPSNVLITDLHELHLQFFFEMVHTISNMQLADPNSKPHGGKIIRDIIEHTIGVRFYPPPGS